MLMQLFDELLFELAITIKLEAKILNNYYIEKNHKKNFVRLDLPQSYLLLQFFQKNELSNRVRRKTRSKFLFPIFEHVFPFF